VLLALPLEGRWLRRYCRDTKLQLLHESGFGVGFGIGYDRRNQNSEASLEELSDEKALQRQCRAILMLDFVD
jgi:hypothetical protein